MFTLPEVFKKTESLLISSAFFLAPLLLFTHSHDQFELPKLVFLGFLAAFLLVFKVFSKQNLFFMTPPLVLALLLLLGTQALSSLPATSLSWSTSLLGDYDNFSGLVTSVVYLLLFFLLVPWIQEKRVEKLLTLTLLSAVLSSLYALVQHFGMDFIRWNPGSVVVGREFASLGNPNFLAAFLAMAFPLLLGLVGKRMAVENPAPHSSLPVLKPLFLFGFLAATLALGLASTASRGGFLGAFCGLLCFSGLVLSNLEMRTALRNKISKIPPTFYFLTLFIFLVPFILFSRPFFARLFSSLSHVADSFATSRLHIWKPAWKMVLANPLNGVGLDTFKIAFPLYSGIEFNQIDGMFVSSRTAHNELLQTAATTGFLGLAAYLGVLIAFVFLWIRAYRSSSISERWILTGVLSSAVAYHVQNLFSFGVSSINLLWFFYLAVVQKFSLKKAQEPVISKVSISLFSSSFIRISLLLLICLLFVFNIRRLAADISFGRGDGILEYLKKPDPSLDPSTLAAYAKVGVLNLRKAADLCPLEVKYRLYLGLAYEQLAQGNASGSKDEFLQSIYSYQKAVQMSPANAYYHNDVGRVCEQLSRFDPAYLSQAQEAYHRAFQLAPASPLFAVNWAFALKKAGRQADSREALRQAFALDPTFTSKLLSQMALDEYHRGNKEAAFEYLAQAIQGNTSCAEAFYCRGIFYLEEGKKKPALADLETAKKLEPNLGSLEDLLNQAKY